MSVGAAEGFHSFQSSKRNLFIENFLSQKSAQKKNSPGPDRTKFTHYFTERTGQMNAEFKRMRQVSCHVFMEVLPQLVMAVLGLGYYWIFISDG